MEPIGGVAIDRALAIARNGDDDRVLAAFFLPEPDGNLVAVHAGQLESEEGEAVCVGALRPEIV